MGGRMADRLLSKGHSVIGNNRTKSKAQWLIDKGMTWGDTPRAVAQAADIVFVMVTDSNALEAVAAGPDGWALSPEPDVRVPAGAANPLPDLAEPDAESWRAAWRGSRRSV